MRHEILIYIYVIHPGSWYVRRPLQNFRDYDDYVEPVLRTSDDSDATLKHSSYPTDAYPDNGPAPFNNDPTPPTTIQPSSEADITPGPVPRSARNRVLELRVSRITPALRGTCQTCIKLHIHCPVRSVTARTAFASHLVKHRA